MHEFAQLVDGPLRRNVCGPRGIAGLCRGFQRGARREQVERGGIRGHDTRPLDDDRTLPQAARLRERYRHVRAP